MPCLSWIRGRGCHTAGRIDGGSGAASAVAAATDPCAGSLCRCRKLLPTLSAAVRPLLAKPLTSIHAQGVFFLFIFLTFCKLDWSWRRQLRLSSSPRLQHTEAAALSEACCEMLQRSNTAAAAAKLAHACECPEPCDAAACGVPPPRWRRPYRMATKRSGSQSHAAALLAQFPGFHKQPKSVHALPAFQSAAPGPLSGRQWVSLLRKHTEMLS